MTRVPMLRATAARAALLMPRSWTSFSPWTTPAAASRMQHTHRRPPQQRRQVAAAAASSAGGPQSDPQEAASPAATTSTAAAGCGTPQPPPQPRQAFKFCRLCGGDVKLVLPEGDDRWRHRCTACGYTDYQNPRMVVGCIVEHEGRILLCRRGIEPQRGLWTVPAGYLECGESSAEGAARETWEEAGARVEVQAPYCTFDIPAISQIYLLFRARLAPPFTFAARQPESLEAALFAPQDIPFQDLAFSSVAIALRSYVEDLERGTFTVHHGVIQKRPGSGPNEPGSFELVGHIALPTPMASR